VTMNNPSLHDKICPVDGCNKARKHRRKHCPMHYSRMCRRGTFDVSRMMTKEINKENAKNKIFRYTKINKETGCWELTSHVTKKGYGRTRIGGKLISSHRLSAYAFLNFDLNSKLFVCHNCPNGDNRKCCNPDHLWIGTNEQNINDAVKKGRFTGNHSRGSLNMNAKLTEDDVLEIKKLILKNITYRTICKKFNVSRGTIGRINTGGSWKHVQL